MVGDLEKPKILIMSFTDHKNDPRVYRQIDALRGDYCLYTAGLYPNETVTQYHYKIELCKLNKLQKAFRLAQLKTKQYEKYYWESATIRSCFKKCSEQEYDVIIANDIETLPVALKLARKSCRVYLDAHEYEPRHWDDQAVFNYFFADYWNYICEQYLPKVHYMTTVSEGIANEYENNFSVKCDIVLNTPDYKDHKPEKVSSDKVKIIHHGGLNKSRKLENMIELMGQLEDRFVLDLMLVNNDTKYMKYLRKKARNKQNIKFIKPVPMVNISSKINNYDIGLFMLPTKAFNYRMSLPNKLFEYIQGRLAVAIWPSPEMKKIVEKEQLGIVSKEFSTISMANALNELTNEEIYKYKLTSDNVAKKYSSINSKEKIRNIVKLLL